MAHIKSRFSETILVNRDDAIGWDGNHEGSETKQPAQEGTGGRPAYIVGMIEEAKKRLGSERTLLTRRTDDRGQRERTERETFNRT